ncbi:MAG: hypothetical protein CVV08_08190 [Gammaproteobacteria bacterium HGW-Gammaproteobacteria-12]|nr:MAG: hypothetical protein CVV08_08190 [Gammaproteobacteria bacterium HGW-Gammaproteobacteria-12]
MKNKLSSKEKELWNRISKILWKNWDPIGVYEEDSEWDDEYDSYVPHIFRLAVEGCDHIQCQAGNIRLVRKSHNKWFKSLASLTGTG